MVHRLQTSTLDNGDKKNVDCLPICDCLRMSLLPYCIIQRHWAVLLHMYGPWTLTCDIIWMITRENLMDLCIFPYVGSILEHFSSKPMT